MVPGVEEHEVGSHDVSDVFEFKEHRRVNNMTPPSVFLFGQGQAGNQVGGDSDTSQPAPDPALFQSVSYLQWCTKLTKQVLRTRTAFSAFLHLSILYLQVIQP